MTWTIALREFKALVSTPMAWIIAAIMQVFFAWYFLSTLEQYLAIQDKLSLQDHAPGITAFLSFRYLAPMSAILLMICPLLTMRTFSDEFRHNTFALLQSSPVGVAAIVMGKFMGAWLFVAGLLCLAVVMPMSLIFLTRIDITTLTLAFIGMLSVAALCTAVGIFFSSLTRHTLVAALSSTTLLLLLWVIGKGSFGSEAVETSMRAVSTSSHLGSFFQGLFDSRDIVYFAVLTLLFLAFSAIRISSFHYSEAPG